MYIWGTRSSPWNLQTEHQSEAGGSVELQGGQSAGGGIAETQVDIALLKKCKTVDVPAVNSVIGNMQKALQKYVCWLLVAYMKFSWLRVAD